MHTYKQKAPVQGGCRSSSVHADSVLRLAVVMPDADTRTVKKVQRDIRRRLEALGFKVTPLGLAFPVVKGGAA
jgi:hypothetical protein